MKQKKSNFSYNLTINRPGIAAENYQLFHLFAFGLSYLNIQGF